MTTSSRRLAFLTAIAFASATIAPFATTRAHADPSAADKATALDLFRAGLKLRDAGDVKGALEKLKGAYALAPTPITGIELARTYAQSALLVEALETCLEVGRMPANAKESANAKKARGEAAQLATDVSPRIPSISVKLAGVPTGATPIVTLDGAEIPAAALDAAHKVDPGTHVIAAHVGAGPETTVSIDVEEGEAKEVPLTVEAPKAPVVPPLVTTTTTSETKSNAPPAMATVASRTSPWVYVGFGVAGAGLLVGALTGGLALSKASKVKNECFGKDCPPGTQGDIDSAKTMATFSTLGWITAGVGVGVGVVGLLLSPSSEPRPATSASLDVWIGAGSAGLRGAF